MNRDIGSVNNGVAHSLVRIVQANLGSDAPPQPFRGTQTHFLKPRKILLDTSVTPLRGDSMPTFMRHAGEVAVLLGWARARQVGGVGIIGIISVCLTVADDLHSKAVQPVEMV